jgi:hypothetical protein
MVSVPPDSASFQQIAPLFGVARGQRRRKAAPKPPQGPHAIVQQLLDVLGAAYKASKRDEEGYASLPEMGQRAKAVSSFAVRNYGYTRLSDLIRAVPNFDVKTGDDGRLLVRRLR